MFNRSTNRDFNEKLDSSAALGAVLPVGGSGAARFAGLSFIAWWP
jgi:hypothetical protein